MAEIWGAAITVGGGLLSGIGASKKDKQDKKYNREQTVLEGRLGAANTGYEMALQDYYKQKDRFEKQRGLDQFRQFSSMARFAPNSSGHGEGVSVPTMPNYNAMTENVTKGLT